MQIESRTCQACLSNYAEMQPFLCKITQFLSYKHQNAREIIHIYNSLTLKYALFRFLGSWRVMGTGTLVHFLGSMNLSPMIPEITSNPPNRPIWFVIYPLWFVDTSFCISNTQQLLKIASISTLFFQNPCTIQINVLPLQQQFLPRLFIECVPRQDFVFL